MKLLLDTHVLIWWAAGDVRLSEPIRRHLREAGNELFVSAVVAIEIGVKVRLGKLKLLGEPETFIRETMTRLGAYELPVAIAHGLQAGKLPPHHRDPFDRLLVAQAQLEAMALLSVDSQLTAYGIPIIG